jgi:cardiolipin synthase A/B
MKFRPILSAGAAAGLIALAVTSLAATGLATLPTTPSLATAASASPSPGPSPSPDLGPSSRRSPSSDLGLIDTPPSDLRLIDEPAAGMSPIYDLLSSAKTSVDLVIYQRDDPRVTQILDTDAARGVDVRVILDQSSDLGIKAYNQPAYDTLSANGVHVEWASTVYTHTHEKAFVIDGTTAVIMTLNFSDEYYSTSRDFAVVDTDPADVASIESVFNYDFAIPSTRSYNVDPPGSDLTWSPSNPDYPPRPRGTGTTGESSADLLAVIDSATTTLSVENEEMDDYRVIDALVDAAARGVRVHVVMTYDSAYLGAWRELTDRGVQVATYKADAALYIHAKVIVADQGLADQRVFIGSENFSATSLDDNRELGIVTTDPSIVAEVGDQVELDFTRGGPFPGTPSDLGPATPAHLGFAAASETRGSRVGDDEEAADDGHPDYQ